MAQFIGITANGSQSCGADLQHRGKETVMPKVAFHTNLKTTPEAAEIKTHNRWHPDIPMTETFKPGAEFRVKFSLDRRTDCSRRQCQRRSRRRSHKGPLFERTVWGRRSRTREDPKSCIASPFGTSSTIQSSDGMTHQRRTSLLTKDEQSTSSIGSTLTWSLISSGACIRASLKILRLPLFSPQLSPAAPTP